MSAQASIARFINSFGQHLHANGEDDFLMKLRRAAAVDNAHMKSGVEQRSAPIWPNEFSPGPHLAVGRWEALQPVEAFLRLLHLARKG